MTAATGVAALVGVAVGPGVAVGAGLAAGAVVGVDVAPGAVGVAVAPTAVGDAVAPLGLADVPGFGVDVEPATGLAVPFVIGAWPGPEPTVAPPSQPASSSTQSATAAIRSTPIDCSLSKGRQGLYTSLTCLRSMSYSRMG